MNNNLDNIFDLSEGAKQYMKEEKEEKEEQQEKQVESPKKPRKKVELSDEKKAAMLERLRLGREKKAENLKSKNAKKIEIKEVKENKMKEVKENKMKEVKKTIDTENERLSFINMMSGKARPIKSDKFERPKKKIISIQKEEVKQDKINDTLASVSIPINTAPVAVVREPVVIRTFKKPIWG